MIIKNKSFDTERALYGSRDIIVENCSFDGPADGESALKESDNVTAVGCYFNLRYPFWHDRTLIVDRCRMTGLCRAALWYCEDVNIIRSELHGIKALRECERVSMEGCDVISPEFGWSVNGLQIERCRLESEYFLMRSTGVRMTSSQLKGKYSFQYTEDVTVENCELDTKDAFWHAKNVTVKDSVINGEYLGWYSDGLTLINCTVTGTQPLCYCKNLKLINCRMDKADLAFEKSEVDAVLTAPVISIKNPRAGRICVPAVGEVIMDDEKAECEIVTTGTCQAQ